MLGWEVIPRIPLGNLSVSPHGVGIAVGYFIGATLMARRARKNGFDEDHAWNAAVVGILGAIIGARLAYVVGHSNQFNEPIEYLQIYKGGISLMGGLLGGFFAAWLYCRAKKLDFVRLADMGAAGLAIGTAVGRIGDLVIGDHLGRTTEGFWGWEYQGGELISAPPCDPAVYPSANGCIEPGMVVHQTALYDSLWALVIFAVILRLERKPHPKGFLVLTWAAMYSIGRILTDLTRVDKTWFGTGLTGSQLTAIAVLLFSLIWLTRLRRKRRVAAVAPGGDGEPDAVGAPAADSDAVPAQGETAATEPEAEAVEAEASPEPPSTEPAEPVVTSETVEAPPEGADETPAADDAGEDPLVPVEPVNPVAPEAVGPDEASAPDPAPEAEPVEALRETVAAADAADAVVVEASEPAEAGDQEAAGALMAEEPVGAEAIDSMPLPETPSSADTEPGEPASPATEVLEVGPAGTESPEEPDAPPPAGESDEGRQEP